MAALERWRENGVGPAQIVASRVTSGVVESTQPLCPYPEEAVYTGSGSVRDAENYTCKVR